MEYVKLVRVCVHFKWGAVYVLGQGEDPSEDLYVLWETIPEYRQPAIQLAKAIAAHHKCEYGCDEPYELREDDVN